MIKGFVLQCRECRSEQMIGVERFEHFVEHPLLCPCGNIPPGQGQKLFWVAMKLDRLWRELPRHGILPAGPPEFIKTSREDPKMRCLPFRLKYSRDMKDLYPLWKEDITGYEPEAPAVFDYASGTFQLLHHTWQDNWKLCLELEQVAFWMTRLNWEMAELTTHKVLKADPYAVSAIHRKRR